jgi:hypothetical protein
VNGSHECDKCRTIFSPATSGSTAPSLQGGHCPVCGGALIEWPAKVAAAKGPKPGPWYFWVLAVPTELWFVVMVALAILGITLK